MGELTFEQRFKDEGVPWRYVDHKSSRKRRANAKARVWAHPRPAQGRATRPVLLQQRAAEYEVKEVKKGSGHAGLCRPELKSRFLV